MQIDINSYDILKITLPASKIPDGQKVTKINGHTEFFLKKSIKVWACEEHVVSPKDRLDFKGTFLVSQVTGDLTQIALDTMLQWHVEAGELAYSLTCHWDFNERNRHVP